MHGNSTKKESAPDGSLDQNVFDIMQGVSINIFIKTGKKKEEDLGEVFHYDLFGKRELKYNFLLDNEFKKLDYKKVEISSPNYYFVPKNLTDENDYFQGFYLPDLMPFKTSGIKTHDDKNLVSINARKLSENLLGLNIAIQNDKIQKYLYRPFENQFIYYDTKLLGRAREKTIYHLKQDNLGLILVSEPQVANILFFDSIFITNRMTDTNMFRRGGPSTFPLYLYPETSIEGDAKRIPNLNMEIVENMATNLGLHFSPERPDYSQQTEEDGLFYPEDILDYIYAVLHSPSYREKYKEFLKIDFPRVPYPKDAETYFKLVNLGREIREIHLLESPVVENYITQYPEDGDNVVDKPVYKDGRVYINSSQYFESVPEVAWNFYIGGYQPAQKWLKDRKGRTLDFDDILHYQKIIVALAETDRLMKEVDGVMEENKL